MITSAIFRSVVLVTMTTLLVLPSRALPSDGGGSTDGTTSESSTSDTADAPPPAPTPAPPMAPGGGTGGTIGSLPTATKKTDALNILRPSFFNFGAPGVTYNGPFTVVAGPPKMMVASYGWLVNGVPVYGGPLNQIGPVLAFPTADVKAASITTSSCYLTFHGTDGAVIAFVDVKKLL